MEPTLIVEAERKFIAVFENEDGTEASFRIFDKGVWREVEDGDGVILSDLARPENRTLSEEEDDMDSCEISLFSSGRGNAVWDGIG